MKEKLGPVSKKDMVFITIIFVALIVMTVFDTSVEILVDCRDDVLQITSPRLNIDIRHQDVLSLELVDMPPFGTKIGDSYEHEAYCAGTWENNDWGRYTLCVIPGNAKCILVEVENSGFVVFSCTTDEETIKLFDSYCNYREALAA